MHTPIIQLWSFYIELMINFAYRENSPLETMCAERNDSTFTYTLNEKRKSINDNSKYSTNKRVKPNNT